MLSNICYSKTSNICEWTLSIYACINKTLFVILNENPLAALFKQF
jgi:hypothetical protein